MMKELSLKELQQVSLDILKEVHAFCMENDLKYSVAFGTLIGAIRHHGFIPWDDDIDIVMPRPDYERFCQTFQSQKYKVKYRGNDKNCMIAFARVYDDQRTTTQDPTPWCKEPVGVWIDIFPLDGAPLSPQVQLRRFEQVRRLWIKAIKMRHTSVAHFSKRMSLFQKYKLLSRKVRFLNGHAIGHVLNKHERIMRKVPFGSTPYAIHLTVLDSSHPEVIKMDCLKRYRLKTFEDTEVMVFEDYDEILRITYGDYMQLPPEEDRVGHSTQEQIKYFWKD